MRTLLFIIASALLLSGCKSKEEKANELIKDNMFKVLFDFASYEPIETKIDSAFTSIYTDSIITNHGYILMTAIDKVNEYFDEVKDAQQTMNIWDGGYSSYSNAKYYEAKNKMNEILEKAKICSNILTLYSDSIKDRAKLIKKEFCGWKATHKFRCKTKGGSPDLGNYEYILDKDIKKILYKIDLDDVDYIKIKKLIDEAIENKKD